MAWTAPMTAVATQVWTASAFNTHVRDNLNETAPAKATTDGSIFTVTAANSINDAPMLQSTVAASETTTSTTFANLTTVGPSVTVSVNTAATVIFGCQMSNSSVDTTALMSVGIYDVDTGSELTAPSDTWCQQNDGSPANSVERGMVAHRFTGLTSGSYTFQAKYRVGAGTGAFSERYLFVIPA